MDAIRREGRDNARTPMQWSNAPHGGFTEGTPWIEANANYTHINAEQCINDPNSVYQYYRQLIQLRKKEPAVVYGSFEVLCQDAPDLFVYKRHYEGTSLFVVINHSDQPCPVPEALQDPLCSSTYVMGNYTEPAMLTQATATTSHWTHLRPFEAVVLKRT